MTTRPLTLHITGMSCSHCLNAVNQALGRLAGVTIESVRIGRADLQFDESVVRSDQIAAAVMDAGYSARIAEPANG